MKLYRLFLILFLYLPSLLQGGAIIVDLGGVLVGTDTSAAVQHMGIGTLLHYLGWYARSPRKDYLTYLSRIIPHDPTLPIACDDEGNRLPQLMYEWLMGTRSCQDIRSIITTSLAQDGSLSLASKHIFYSMTRMIFTPEIFVQTRTIYHDMLDLIAEYKHKGHRVFIGSNWDAESFELFTAKNPDLVELFDGAIISGVIHLLKPQCEFFEYGMSTYGLNPTTTVLIDDQLENIRGARMCGLSAIHCTPSKEWLNWGPDVAQVRAELELWHHQISGGGLPATSS